MYPPSATSRFTCLCLFVLLFIGFFSCTNEQNTKRQFVLADSLMLIRPDSALKILEEMKNPEQLSEKEKVNYYLLLIEARDKNYIKHTSDSLINYVFQVYENRKDDGIKAKVLFYKGRVYHDLQKFEEAALYYKKAETIAKQTSSYRLLALVYSELGSLNLWQDLYDNAFEYYEKSYNAMLQASDTASVVYLLRDMGRVRLLQSRYDAAFPFYKKASEVADRYHKTKAQSEILYETAILYDQQHKTDSMVYYMRKSVTYNPDIVSTDEVSLGIADVYRKAGMIDSALVYLTKCLQSENMYSKAGAYKYLSEINESQHNPTKALEYHKIYTNLKDTIASRTSAEALTEVLVKYDNEKLENEKTEILLEKTRTMRNLYLVLLVSMLLGATTLTAFYLYGRQKERQLRVLRQRTNDYKKQIEANQSQIKANERWVAEKEKLIKDTNLKLEEKEVQLYKLKQKEDETFRLKIENLNLKQIRMDLNKEIDSLTKRKEKIAVINAGIESQYTLIERLRMWKSDDPILTETEQNQLPDLMDKMCDNFTSKLQNQYPTLKSHDILICCLIKLRISNENIASLTSCKYESVLTKRSRIKQRMQEKEVNLETILNRI